MRIVDYLQIHHVRFQPVLHAPVPSASRRAHTAHISGRQVAKSVLVRSADSYVLVVLPATTRIDLEQLSQALGGVPVALAHENELAQVFGDCELGALPPFGGAYGLHTVVDASLASDSEILCASNTRHEGFRLRYRDYETLEAPLRVRFAVSIDATTREERRRAG